MVVMMAVYSGTSSYLQLLVIVVIMTAVVAVWAVLT